MYRDFGQEIIYTTSANRIQRPKHMRIREKNCGTRKSTIMCKSQRAKDNLENFSTDFHTRIFINFCFLSSDIAENSVEPRTFEKIVT